MLTFFFCFYLVDGVLHANRQMWKWVFCDVTKDTNRSPIEVTTPLVSRWLCHLLWFPLILVEIAIKCQF